MTTHTTGEPDRTVGSPITQPPTAWRHAGGDSDGECDACWAELDVETEIEPRSDPHEAAPDRYQLASGTDGLFCAICGHDVEAVPA